MVRITIPSGIVAGWGTVAAFPTTVDLSATYADGCEWQAVIKDMLLCSSWSSCVQGTDLSNPPNVYYLGLHWYPYPMAYWRGVAGQAFARCGAINEVLTEGTDGDPVWGWYQFQWNGAALLIEAAVSNEDATHGRWTVTFQILAQSAIDLTTSYGSVPLLWSFTPLPMTPPYEVYCMSGTYPNFVFEYRRILLSATYSAVFDKDAVSGCRDPIVLDLVTSELEGLYSGAWPATITLDPQP